MAQSRMTDTRCYHHGDLPGALLRAAAEMFDRRGAAALSLRAAADEVGGSASAVCRHIRDKDALLRAAAASDMAKVGMRTDIAAEEVDGTDLRGRLLAVAGAYIGFAVEHPELHRLVFGPHGLGREGRGSDASPPRP